MALDKLDQTYTSYTKAPLAQIASLDDLKVYLDRELSKIEIVLSQLTAMTMQSATAAPKNPKRGMQRYAKSPWNPLGTGDGPVKYTSTWVAI